VVLYIGRKPRRAFSTALGRNARTAGVHVSRILTMLAVPTRTEAAAFDHGHNLLAGTG
jgi:DNA-binding NarL/FixJ family response regulator